MTVSKRLRYEVLRRDNHACRYCGGIAPDAILTVDHVTPVALGGSDAPENLVAACVTCNAGKAASNPGAPLVADVAEDALRWATALQVAAQDALRAVDDKRQFIEYIDGEWAGYLETSEYPRPLDWEDTVVRWRSLGMHQELIVDAMHIAMRNTRVRYQEVWRYTCGIVWNRLTEMQNAARASLAITPTPVGCAHCGYRHDDCGYEGGSADGVYEEWNRHLRTAEHVQWRALSALVDHPSVSECH